MSNDITKELDTLISLISEYDQPFTLNDLLEAWKKNKMKDQLDSSDYMLVKYVLSSMCSNGQVVYHEGAYGRSKVAV